MPLVPNYAPTDWVDGVTPVNEARMDNIDTNLDLHADAINTLDTRLATEEAMPDIPTVVNGSWIKGVGGAMVWSTIAQADVTGLVTALASKEATANKGVANGYAPLDAGSKVPTVNLPAPLDLRWMGTYSGATGYLEGDVVIYNNISYMALRATTNETPVPWSSGSASTNAKSVLLTPGAAILPDGSAGNLAPAMNRIQGSETNPKKHFLVLAYDGAGGLELAWWSFRLPTEYASGGTLRIAWMANAVTATAVKWQARVAAITPADADTPVEHAEAAAATVTTNINTTEARRLIESSITLTLDSAAAGDTVFVTILRDSADAADTCLVDAELIAANFEYTST